VIAALLAERFGLPVSETDVDLFEGVYGFEDQATYEALATISLQDLQSALSLTHFLAQYLDGYVHLVDMGFSPQSIRHSVLLGRPNRKPV